jgi:hypothetical protein
MVCRDPGRSALRVADLAQSVQVTAYECQLALRGTAAIHSGQLRFDNDELPAGVEALEKLYEHRTGGCPTSTIRTSRRL